MLANVKHVNAGFALVLPWKKLNGLRGKLFNLQNSICHFVTIVTSAEILRKSAISPYFSGNSIYAGKPRC